MSLRRQRIAIAILAVLISNASGLAQQVAHNARGFDCGFIYEKTKGGKSGDASCSYDAKKVFGSALFPFTSRSLCKTEKVFQFDDIRLQINFDTKKAVWEHKNGLAPFATKAMINYYMQKQKLSKEAATRKVMQSPQLGLPLVTYQIFHVYKGEEFVSDDPITHALPSHPRNMPVYTVTFGWNVSNDLYSIFIPDNGTDINAILTHYVSNGSYSWVNLRFGKCRPLK